MATKTAEIFENHLKQKNSVDHLLKDPVRFVPPKTTSLKQTVPYRAVNEDSTRASTSETAHEAAPSTHGNPSVRVESDPAPVNTDWPEVGNSLGRGLHNIGNTCFLNSALQLLVHCPPLVRAYAEKRHPKAKCKRLAKGLFCAACAMRTIMAKSLDTTSSSAYTPVAITDNIRKIARHFYIGRQEDSHELLRFLVDEMDMHSFSGIKQDDRKGLVSFVADIFGGKLRSRILCLNCKHASDTYEPMMDLSLDILHASSVREGLQAFTKKEKLSGDNKYRCDHCKQLSNALKYFTIDRAPPALTLQLKRFKYTGSKATHLVKYAESLDLTPYMSEADVPQKYTLAGVVCHAGGGVHSGHYYSFVKTRQGRWAQANDSSVTLLPKNTAPVNVKQAYILLYIRNPSVSNGNGKAQNGAVSGGRGSQGAMDVDGHSSQGAMDVDSGPDGDAASGASATDGESLGSEDTSDSASASLDASDSEASESGSLSGESSGASPSESPSQSPSQSPSESSSESPTKPPTKLIPRYKAKTHKKNRPIRPYGKKMPLSPGRFPAATVSNAASPSFKEKLAAQRSKKHSAKRNMRFLD